MLVLKSNQLIVKTWFDKEGKVHAVERIKKKGKIPTYLTFISKFLSQHIPKSLKNVYCRSKKCSC